MIKSKERRAQVAFKRALAVPQQRNYSTEMCEHLLGEVESLNQFFVDRKIPVRIRGTWVENDLSAAIVLEQPSRFDEATPFLKMQVTPLSAKKAQIVANYASVTADSKKPSKVKLFHHMDKEKCTEEFMREIRVHILSATPFSFKDDVEAVLTGHLVDDQNFKDYKHLMGSIPAKYGGAKDPHQAYIQAHAEPA